MQGSVSNFADFQFCPPPSHWRDIKLSLRVSLSFNIKCMQKKLLRTISKWRYIKKVTFYFKKKLSFSTSLLTLLPLGSEVTRGLKQNLNIHSLIWYLNQVTKPQKNWLMPMLWVVTFMQVFWESHYAYMCIMQGSASNFAEFQFWPYCPSLNCYNFCSSPSLPMKGISN